MPRAEIITIGTEILLGEIVDTNSRFIARRLRDLGVDLYRKTTVGDNAQRIAQAIIQAMEGCEIIITSGGLGPTVDDPTREAVALALGVELEFRPELWEQIQARFKRFGRKPTENNRRQAYVPTGALEVENPVGTAPAFIVESDAQVIAALPGVPHEMEYLLEHTIMPYLQKRFSLAGTIKARILHTAGAGESQIDDLIEDLERLTNPTVGLSAHSGQVDVRITAKASSEREADELIRPVENELRERLGDWVYGVDGDTLESVALAHLNTKKWKLVVVEAGLGGLMIRRLAAADSEIFLGGEVITDLPTPDKLIDFVNEFRRSRKAEVGLGVAVYPGSEKQDVLLICVTPAGDIRQHRPYGGPPAYSSRWAFHHSLNLLRNI